MKQFVGILILLMVMSVASSGQSRVLVGTISSKPNESTTLLPSIVTIKNTQGQVNDTAIFNPRYVAPVIDNNNNNPAVTNNNNQDFKTQQTDLKKDNVVITNNQPSNPQNKLFLDGHTKSVTLTPLSPNPPTNESNTINDETYQDKTSDGKPVVDKSNNQQTLTPTISYRQPNKVSTSSNEYHYKTPDAKPVLNKSNNQQTLTPTVSYKQPDKATSNEDVYQYKTPDPSPQMGYSPEKKNRVPPPGFHTTRKALVNDADNVTDPDDLTANANYGNEPEKNVAKVVKKRNKWVNPNVSKKGDYIANASSNATPDNNDTKLLTPPVRVKSVQKKKAVNTLSYNQGSQDNIQSDNNSSKQYNQTNNSVRPDYKINLTNDGKYTLTFSNNGGSVVLTEFGRIANVTSPLGGNNNSPQYNYRGLLDKVGNLPLQYTYEGRVQSVGSTQLDYNYNGNIQTIGNTSLYYNYNGTIDKIGNTKVYYDANGNVNGTSDANPIIAMKQ